MEIKFQPFDPEIKTNVTVSLWKVVKWESEQIQV